MTTSISNTVQATTLAAGTAPSAPSGLTASAITATGFTVSWTASTGSPTILYQPQYRPTGTTPWVNYPASPISGLSTTFAGLQPATQYDVQVVASNDYGTTPSATTSVSTIAQAPNAPTNVAAAAAGTSGVAVSWTPSTIGTTPIVYAVSYRSPPGSGSFTAFPQTVSTPATGLTVTGLAAGTQYEFEVQASNSAGSAMSATTAVATTNSGTVIPGTPTALTASNITTTSIQVSWTVPATGTGPFTNTVQYAPSGTTSWTTAGTTTDPTDTLVVSGLSPATKYDFRVSSTNGAGTGPWSNILTATTLAVAPTAPTNITATTVDTGSITVGWTAPATGTTPLTYSVSYRTPPGSGSYTTFAATVTTPATSLTVTGLAAGTQYEFEVTATNSAGSATSATTATATTKTAIITPGAPTTLSASNITASAVQVSWVPPSTGTSPFNNTVQFALSGTGNWSTAGTTTDPTDTLVVSGLAAATKYDFRVSSNNSAGTGPWSSTLTTTTLEVAPTAPTNITATTAGTSSVTVGWTAPTTGSTPLTYTVAYRTPPGSGTFNNFATTATTPATSLLVTGLASGTQYEFEVTASNNAGSATSATTATATTQTVVVIPGAPTNLSASNITTTSVQLSWSAPSSGTAPFTYTAQYAPTGTGSWVTIGTTTDPTTTITASGLASGTTYDFRVTASNSAGSGPASATLTTTTTASGPSVRHPNQQPGADASMWNTPLGNGAVWSKTGDADTTSLRAKVGSVNGASYGITIYTAAASDPLVKFTSTADATQQRDAALTVSLHCPATATPSPGSDAQMVIFDATTDATKMWCFNPCSFVNGKDVTGGVNATYGEQDVICGVMEDAITGNFGYNAGIGVIRAWELDPTKNPSGLIQHGLRFSCDVSQLLPPPAWDKTTNADGSVAIYWPETHTDFNGPTAYTGKMPAGATIGIPSNIAMPSGLSTGGQMLWKCLQNYGAHWRDTSSGGITFYTEPSADQNSYIVGMRGDMATICANLCVLRNQGPTTIQGGGTPVTSGPPSVDSAVCGTATAPGQITGVTVSSTTTSTVSLTWNAPTGTAPVAVYIRYAPHGTTSWTSINVGNGATSGTVTGLAASTEYDFEVYGQNSAGTGAYSSIVNATTKAAAVKAWDSTTVTAAMTISSDTYTATSGTVASGTAATARSVSSFTSGKIFWEITASAITTDWSAGLVNANFNGTAGAGLGGDTNGIGFYPVNPADSLWYNATEVLIPISSQADVGNAVISFAADITNGLLWVTSPGMRAITGATAWNDSTTANPATGTGGVAIGVTGALYIAFNTLDSASAAVLNIGGSAFSIAIPTGFTAADGGAGAGGGSTVPGAPTNLAVTSITSTSAYLSWSAPTTGGTPTSYTIQAAVISNLSQNGDLATKDAQNQLIDNSKNTWSINVNGALVFNGSVVANTSAAVVLAYEDPDVWVLNSLDNWYSYTATNGAATFVSGPAANPMPQSANNTDVTGIGTHGITDASGNLWTLTTTEQVALNGIAQTVATNVVELGYVSGVVWLRSATAGWASVGVTNGAAALTSATGQPSPFTGTPTGSGGGTVGTRNYWDHPGTQYCFWNTPLGDACTWGAATDADTIDLRHGGIINPPSNYGSPVWVSTSTSDPTATFNCNQVTDYGNVVVNNPSILVHLPAGCYSAGPYTQPSVDEAFNFFDTNNQPGFCYSVGPVDIENFQGGNTYNLPNGSMFRDQAMTDLYAVQAEVGSQYSLTCGCIRGYDIDGTRNPARIPGTSIPAIQHVLRYSHDPIYLKANGPIPGGGPLGNNSWPKNYEDYQSTSPATNNYTGNLLYGTHVGIPINTPEPSGLTDAGKQLFWTLQHYGACIGDASSGGLHLFADQDVCGKDGTTTWYTNATNDLKNLIVPLLCPLRNQHQFHQNFADYPMNGPGQRLDSGPGPLAIPSGFPTPSANYTTITPGSGSITDSFGTVWTVTTGGQIAIDGTVDTSTSASTQLSYVNGILWVKNSGGNWYSRTAKWNAFEGQTTTDPIATAKANVYGATTGTSATTGTTSGGSITPSDVIKFLKSISGAHTVTGQYIELGTNATMGFAAIQTIYNNTGKWLGLIGGDYYWFGQGVSEAAHTDFNSYAKTYWTNGGLIELSLSMPNPSSGGGCEDGQPVNATNTLTSGTTENNNLMTMLGQIGDGLLDLQNSGVIVLFRLFHENDGNWFWWGTQNFSDADFVSLWKLCYNYLVTTKGCKNLVWVWAGNSGYVNTNRLAAGYVDMAGYDLYTDNPGSDTTDYNTVVGTGLPAAICEFGPGSPSVGDTTFNEGTLITALKNNLPDVVYFLQWWDGNGTSTGWGMASTSNWTDVKNALSDSRCYNRGDFSIKGTGGTSGGIGGAWQTVGTSTSTSGTASNLTPGTEYGFQIIASDAAGSGSPSTMVTDTTLSNATTGPQLLPSGPLFVGSGLYRSQIVDANNVPVRIAAIGWDGGNSTTPSLDGLDQIYWQQTLKDIVRYGFNTVRILTCDRAVLNDAAISNVNYSINSDLQNLTYLGVLDKIIDYCGTIGLRVIIDSHNNDGKGVTQQANGLWYDKGGASNGTDGGGNTGTISDANGPVPLGLYAGNPGDTASGSYPGFDAQWDGFVSAIGRSPTFWTCYMDQTYTPTDTTFGWALQPPYLTGIGKGDTRTANCIPVFGWPFGYNSGSGAVNLFTQISGGSLDTTIQNTLIAWKTGGYSTVYIRPAWEFNLNNNYAVTSTNLSAFIAAWQHFYTLIHSTANANGMTVKIIWNPNVGNNQNSPSLTVAQQYPGDAYVDLYGIDTYGSPVDGSHTPGATTTDNTQYLVTTMLNMANASNKAVCFPEVGGIDTSFARSMVSALTNRTQPVRIEYFGFWDIDNSDGNLSWTNASDNQGTLTADWEAGFGPSGSVTNSSDFVAAWTTRAQRWKGKAAILGYDLRHEPLAVGHATPGCTWGGYTSVSGHTGTVGSNQDLRDAYQRAGSAILTIDPNPLIICEAPIDFPSGAYSGDLRCAVDYPVVLTVNGATVSNKTVYSVHEYPTEIAGYGGRNDPGGLGSADTGATYIKRMQTLWGILIVNNTAPVFVGRMGDYCTTTDAQNWASTIVPYLNGTASGGFSLSNQQQGVSWCWWAWAVDKNPGGTPDYGVQSAWGASGVPRVQQQQYWDKLLYLGQRNPSAPLVTAPLSTTATTGTWVLDSINGMSYWYLLPSGYTEGNTYPLVLYLHQNDLANAFYSGGNDPTKDAVKPQIDAWFNTTTFRTNHPCIVVAPLLNQTADASGNTINWGGINTADQTGQDNAIALVQYFMEAYPVYSHRVYVTGNGPGGGSGAWDAIIKYNSQTGDSGTKLFTAALILAGAEYDYGYPNPTSTVVANLKSVPIFAIHGGTDTTVPLNWDQNMWTADGGTTPYPGPNGTEAPNATYWYLQDPNLGNDVWDTYYTQTFVWDWLFKQSH